LDINYLKNDRICLLELSNTFLDNIGILIHSFIGQDILDLIFYSNGKPLKRKGGIL